MADVLAPLGPVPIEQPRDVMRLDRILFCFLGAAARCRLRPGTRDTRPRRTRCACRRARKRVASARPAASFVTCSASLPSASATNTCGAPRARRDEREALAVGRAGGRRVRRVAADEQRAAARSRRRARPRCRRCGGRSRGLVVVRTNATVRAVGRERRLGDADRRDQVVDGHRPRGLTVWSSPRQHDHQAQQDDAHSAASHAYSPCGDWHVPVPALHACLSAEMIRDRGQARASPHERPTA